MKHRIAILLLMLLSTLVRAQGETAPEGDKQYYTREGNKMYAQKRYNKAAEYYNKGADTDPASLAAAFNLGDTYYRQGKYEEARQQFDLLTARNLSADTMSLIWHNLGNSLLQLKEYEKSIEAYKKALRYNPADDDSRYNLAYAQKMLKKQREQQQKQPDDKQQDKQKDKENEDQKKKEQEKKDQLNKEKEKLQQEKKDLNQEKKSNEQKQQDPKTGQQEKQQLEKRNGEIDKRMAQIEQRLKEIEKQLREMQGLPEPKNQLSKEEARRMLEALSGEEKRTREKLDKKSKNYTSAENEKDW